MPLADTVRRNIRKRRKELCMSQIALANKAGYASNYIARLERGVKQNPTLFFVEAVAGALGCDPLDLMKEE